MRSSKYRTTKRLFYAGLIFTSLSLFSAGFASFNIYDTDGESVQGKVDIANIIEINLTDISEGFKIYNYKISDYSNLGFVHQGTLPTGETYNYYNLTCYFDLYFHIVSKESISNYKADINVNITQNNVTNYSYFEDVNFSNKGATINYTTNQNDITASGSDANTINSYSQVAINNGTRVNFTTDLNLSANQMMYFHLRCVTTFANNDNYNDFYNWVGSITTPFSFNVTAIISQGGN